MQLRQSKDTFEGKDIGAILKAIGMKLVSTVGGASGPLYGTAFMKSGALLNGKTEMDMNDFIEMLQVSIDGIMKRGKAVKGEKTMLDAMIPAHDAIAASYEADGDAKESFRGRRKGSGRRYRIYKDNYRNKRSCKLSWRKKYRTSGSGRYFIYINA